jgi:hypothetical protein
VLSILCVSDCKPRALPFIENLRALAGRLDAEFVLVQDGKDVHSAGYLESVLDEAIAMTYGDYILRVDDDEKVSPVMERWLATKEYEMSDHWSFSRVHFWGDEKTVILAKYYFPDVQTRLSVRAKAGHRKEIHAGSPWGFGTIAPAALEHHVYLVKTYEERLATAKKYISVKFGADGGAVRASAIEDEITGDVQFIEYGEGEVPMRGKTRIGRLRP